MQITFYNPHKIKTIDYEEIKNAAEFYAKILLPKKMAEDIILDIEFDPELDNMAECVCEEDKKNPRIFTISLRCKDDDDEVLQCLAHEMVHLKQSAKNEYESEFGVSRPKHKWMGKTVRFKKNEHRYFDAPWEIEAFGRERSLYDRYMDQKDDAKKD
jgi:RNAse (barnase) inhibitor barstar